MEDYSKSVSESKKDDQHGIAAATGRWIHTHKNDLDKPAGFLGYQVIRSALASIPYGFATAAVWDGFEALSQKAKPRFSSASKLLNSPMRDIAMIAVGFTFYRGSIKLIKSIKEQLFNPGNSEEDTIREVQNIGETTLNKIKEIAPAEVNSTPFGAIALGLARRASGLVEGYNQRPEEYVIARSHPRTLHFSKDGKFGLFFSTPDGQSGFKAWKGDFYKRIVHSKSMMLADVLAWVGGFIAFFELSDRLYKDVQVRRGIWKGEDHSLTKADDSQKGASSTNQVKYRGNYPDTFDGDPSLKTLTMNRVIPTIIGISMYAVLKRASYHIWGNFAGKQTFTRRALTEAAATTPLFVMNATADVFEKMNRPEKGKIEGLRPVSSATYEGTVENKEQLKSYAKEG